MAFGDKIKDREQSGLTIDAVERLGDRIVEGMTADKIKKIPFGRQKIRSPFNPTGKRDRKLNFIDSSTYGGYPMFIKLMTDEEIALINSGRIAPGSYIDNMVKVHIKQTPSGPELHIAFSNDTADKRQSLYSRCHGPQKTGMARLLARICDEGEETVVKIKAARRAEIQDALNDVTAPASALAPA